MNRWGVRAAFLSVGGKIWSGEEILLNLHNPNGLLPHVVCRLFFG